MFDAAQLLLLIGPAAVPVPAPLPLIEALQRVEVNSSGDRTAFQITFSVGKTSLIQLALLPAGFFDPIVTRVVVVVIFRGLPQVLCDGVVTRHELTPSNEAGQSTLTITGEDLSVLMDVVQLKLAYPAMPVEAQAGAILAKYASFGIVPMIIPPVVPTVTSPTTGFAQQTGTDLQYLRGIASQCGYVFYLQSGPLPGQSIAYFGPDPRPAPPLPQPALSVNGDASTNVDSLSFSLDGLAKKVMVVTAFDPITHKIPLPIPVPNINPLRPPLGLRLTPPAKIEFADDVADLAPDELANRVLGFMMEGSDAVTASGSLDVVRYGHILQARGLVGVRGAGITYDGMYYVNSVTHSIKRGEYKQSFQLSRDGLITQTPMVMP